MRLNTIVIWFVEAYYCAIDRLSKVTSKFGTFLFSRFICLLTQWYNWCSLIRWLTVRNAVNCWRNLYVRFTGLLWKTGLYVFKLYWTVKIVWYASIYRWYYFYHACLSNRNYIILFYWNKSDQSSWSFNRCIYKRRPVVNLFIYNLQILYKIYLQKFVYWDIQKICWEYPTAGIATKR